METITGQYYTARLIQGPRSVEAAKDFVKLAGEQVGKTFTFREDGDGNGVSIDLEEWPDDVMFGDWFGKWAERLYIKVED